MAEEKKPLLRVVTPEEAIPPPSASVSKEEVGGSKASVAVPQPSSSLGKSQLDAAIGSVDGTIPENAARLANAAVRVIGVALEIYHQAGAHALPGTFRNDVPPGLKSVEATEAWVGTHVRDLRQVARSSERVEHYQRAEDLKEAIRLSGAELDRAVAVADVAGLKLAARSAEAFSQALRDVEECRDRRKDEVEVENVYVFLGASATDTRFRVRPFWKGAVIGAVVTVILCA